MAQTIRMEDVPTAHDLTMQRKREAISYLRENTWITTSPAGDHYPYITTCDICGSKGQNKWISEDVKACAKCIDCYLGKPEPKPIRWATRFTR